MKEFPAFMLQAANAVKSASVSYPPEGFLYEGRDGTQIVLWQCENGGTCATHTHDYDEYAVVLSGTFTGYIGDKFVTMNPGDECHIPAGIPHSGEYTANYRAIDSFGGPRAQYQNS